MKSSVRISRPIFPRLLLALKLSHREPVETAPTKLALSRGPVLKSQHCKKGSTSGNGSVALSRPDYRQMEVDWFLIVDPRKT
jgi:hypothetical protein